MGLKIDPAVVQLHAENVRAEFIERPTSIKLDAAIVQKISQRVPIFAGMALDTLMVTLGMAEHHPVKAGEPVFAEGDIGGSCYVVILGQVAVEKVRDGRVVQLAVLGPGECFGEMVLVGRHIRSATVRALSDSVTMRFDRERIDSNPQSAHVIYRNIARVLAARLDESSVRLADLESQSKG